jgi:hypothetical protein
MTCMAVFPLLLLFATALFASICWAAVQPRPIVILDHRKPLI